MRGFGQPRHFINKIKHCNVRSAPLRTGPKVESKRSFSCVNRVQRKFQLARTALAYESSTLRYNNFLFSSSEEALLRGWDDDILIDDEDGT